MNQLQQDKWAETEEEKNDERIYPIRYQDLLGYNNCAWYWFRDR